PPHRKRATNRLTNQPRLACVRSAGTRIATIQKNRTTYSLLVKTGTLNVTVTGECRAQKRRVGRIHGRGVTAHDSRRARWHLCERLDGGDSRRMSLPHAAKADGSAESDVSMIQPIHETPFARPQRSFKQIPDPIVGVELPFPALQ